MKNNKKEEREFKGIWIPSEIWLNDKLTIMEKIALVEINSYDKDFGCVATNTTLSKDIGINNKTFGNLIRSLEAKGFLKTSYSDMNSYSGRVIKVIKSKFYGIHDTPLENQEPPLENQEPPLENQEPPLENQEHSNSFSDSFSNPISKESTFCEQGSRIEYSSDFDSQNKVADEKNEYTKNNNIDLFDKKSMASKSGKDKGMYNFTKNMFMAIYEEEFKEKYIWKASDAGSVYPIISGIYEKMVEKNPEKEMTIGDVCLGIETFIRISIKMRDGYFLKSFSVPNLYSKFNDIFLKINETRNGKQSDHLSKRGVTHFKFNVPDPRGTNGQDAGI